MSWMLSLVVGVLAGLFGLLVSGTVAGLLVDWYNISSFEGGSGYFVIGNALLGGIAGFVAGVVVSRLMAGRPGAGFLKATGAACGVVFLVAALTAGIARWLADVPPEIDGQTLFVSVELRWPEGQQPPDALRTQPGVVTLGALRGSTLRVSEDGPLFTDRTANVEGRWMMPGEVRLFTGRGSRLLMFKVGALDLPAFSLPIGSSPVASDRQWSDWMPKTDDVTVAQGFRYRYRIRLANETLRTDRLGPFDVDTRVSEYFRIGDTDYAAARSTFVVRSHDAPVDGLAEVTAVAVLPSGDALVVSAEHDGVCRLVQEQDGRATVTPLGSCGTIADAQVLTRDQVRFEAAQRRRAVPGWVDTRTFDQPGLYRLSDFVFDTRTRQAREFTMPDEFPVHGSEPPLMLSDDERSFVLLAEDRARNQLALVVIDRDTGRGVPLPIDRARMRYSDTKEIGPTWVAHHFAWQPADGRQQLVLRDGFVPLPYHGWLELAEVGAFQSYTLRPGAGPLRDAIVRVLVERLGGQRLDDESAGYTQRVRVDGHEVHLTVGEMPSYVMMSMSAEGSDPVLFRRLAQQLDAQLATGEFDALFVEPAEAP